MPALPSEHSPLVVAHLYTNDPLDDTKDDTKKETYYVPEENVHVVREKSCTTSVNVRGLQRLTCSLNVERFMQVKSTCQWIQFMVYVDDTLLCGAYDEFKFEQVDLQRSANELLSPTFTLTEMKGRIQLVVKTHGPGKKWPHYAFNFDYSKSTHQPYPILVPAPFAPEQSRIFRDVDKRFESIVTKLHEIQYTKEDRDLQESLLQKQRLEEEEEARAASSVEFCEPEHQNEDVHFSTKDKSFTPQLQLQDKYNTERQSPPCNSNRIASGRQQRSAPYPGRTRDANLRKRAMRTISDVNSSSSTSFDRSPQLGDTESQPPWMHRPLNSSDFDPLQVVVSALPIPLMRHMAKKKGSRRVRVAGS